MIRTIQLIVFVLGQSGHHLIEWHLLLAMLYDREKKMPTLR